MGRDRWFVGLINELAAKQGTDTGTEYVIDGGTVPTV
jgi:hypothetical protein